MQRIIRIVMALLLLVAGGSTPVLASGPGMPPFCPPGQICNLLVPLASQLSPVLRDGPGMPPFCPPGQTCN